MPWVVDVRDGARTRLPVVLPAVCVQPPGDAHPALPPGLPTGSFCFCAASQPATAARGNSAADARFAGVAEALRPSALPFLVTGVCVCREEGEDGRQNRPGGTRVVIDSTGFKPGSWCSRRS